jgi:hypothetical protein
VAATGAVVGAAAGAAAGRVAAKIEETAVHRELFNLEVGKRWVPDEEAPNCFRCSKKFRKLRRRHHCRKCGGVFCSKCTQQKAEIILERIDYGKEVRLNLFLPSLPSFILLFLLLSSHTSSYTLVSLFKVRVCVDCFYGRPASTAPSSTDPSPHTSVELQNRPVSSPSSTSSYQDLR